jgi:hypothetical protein
LNQSIVVHCVGGYRSSLAAKLLKKSRTVDVKDLLGGITAWGKSGFLVLDTSAGVNEPMGHKDYSERIIIEVAGWKIRFTSYEIGNKHYSKPT